MAINNREIDELLRTIAAGVVPATGDAFFRLLVQQLCKALNTDFACISELQDARANGSDTVRAFAFYGNDTFLDEVEYELAGTPCQEALAAGRSSYPKSVQSFFPEDRYLVQIGVEGYLGVALKSSSGEPLGTLSVMSRAPMENTSSMEIILSIFASRVSSELERRRAEQALRESESRTTAILNALPEVILVLDKKGVVQNAYAKDSSELKLTRDSIPGRSLDAVLGPEPTSAILGACANLQPGELSVIEYSLPDAGQPRFYEARTVTFGDDKLLTVIRNTTQARRAEAELQESQRFAQRIAETSPNVLFLYDLIERRNVYTNERSVDVIGYTPQEVEAMGENFLRLCMHPEDIASLPALGKEYSSRRDGEVFEHVFRMRHKNGEWRWVQRTATVFSRTPEGLPRQVLGSVADITDLKNAERELQDLSGRLLNVQDEERRRIARELHDVTGQNLTAIGLNLAVLEKTTNLDGPAREILLECQKLCEESKQEIRTLSFLLHPPMLDQFGLIGALEWYITGFKQRTRINVTIDGGHDIGRLPAELENDLFRVIQEALTNIVRYSGSETATIRILKTDANITVKVEDRGKGLPAIGGLTEGRERLAAGVGIPGMRERLRQHGGLLDVRSGPEGTTITAVVPFSKAKTLRPA